MPKEFIFIINARLKDKSYQIAKMSHLGKSLHIGLAFSCLELIYLAYKTFLNINPQNF
jgi:hypothetical protein